MDFLYGIKDSLLRIYTDPRARRFNNAACIMFIIFILGLVGCMLSMIQAPSLIKYNLQLYIGGAIFLICLAVAITFFTRKAGRIQDALDFEEYVAAPKRDRKAAARQAAEASAAGNRGGKKKKKRRK